MTEQSIIERAARALLARQEPSLLWDDLVDFDQKAFKLEARDVLTAIREPSDAMVEAGVAAFTNVRDIWQAMIDAALAE